MIRLHILFVLTARFGKNRDKCISKLLSPYSILLENNRVYHHYPSRLLFFLLHYVYTQCVNSILFLFAKFKIYSCEESVIFSIIKIVSLLSSLFSMTLCHLSNNSLILLQKKFDDFKSIKLSRHFRISFNDFKHVSHKIHHADVVAIEISESLKGFGE